MEYSCLVFDCGLHDSSCVKNRSSTYMHIERCTIPVPWLTRASVTTSCQLLSSVCIWITFVYILDANVNRRFRLKTLSVISDASQKHLKYLEYSEIFNKIFHIFHKRPDFYLHSHNYYSQYGLLRLRIILRILFIKPKVAIEINVDFISIIM